MVIIVAGSDPVVVGVSGWSERDYHGGDDGPGW